jgi:RAMP superfamily protein
VIGHLVVELVTPAMIGGAKARQCDDPPTLRPPSLRGHLRFWSRALGGKKLADELWGSTDVGQRVRLLGTQRLSEPKPAILILSKPKSETPMIPPGDKVVLRFGIPESIALDHLQAVVWAWLHLGTVGRRSRRGYGSLQWLPSEGDLLKDWPPLWPNHHLKSAKALEAYLREGLDKVASICGRPGRNPRQATDALLSQDQVFVGSKELKGKWQAETEPAYDKDSLEHIVHGLNEDARGPEPERSQLGFTKPHRLPSPILWRFFPIPGKAAFRSVMVWFPTDYPANSPVHLDLDGRVFDHLRRNFGFQTSLAGNALAAPQPPARD